MTEQHDAAAYLYTREDGSRDLLLDCSGEHARNLLELGATETPLYTRPASNSGLVEALKFYADTYCEGVGECKGDFCGKLPTDTCGGCLAYAALRSVTHAL